MFVAGKDECGDLRAGIGAMAAKRAQADELIRGKGLYVAFLSAAGLVHATGQALTHAARSLSAFATDSSAGK